MLIRRNESDFRHTAIFALWTEVGRWYQRPLIRLKYALGIAAPIIKNLVDLGGTTYRGLEWPGGNHKGAIRSAPSGCYAGGRCVFGHFERSCRHVAE